MGWLLDEKKSKSNTWVLKKYHKCRFMTIYQIVLIVMSGRKKRGNTQEHITSTLTK